MGHGRPLCHAKNPWLDKAEDKEEPWAYLEQQNNEVRVSL